MLKKLHIFAALVLTAFFANAQTITVTSPNGGEVWAGCTVHNITWTSAGVSNNYNIDYSTNGGTSWVSVASSLNIVTGSYSWTVPNINSTSCKVRIVDSSTPTTSDVSDNTFSITAPLLLTSPNGGESWQAGSVKTITWAANATSNYYDIKYSTNAGSTWTTIVTNTYITTQQYNWTVPNVPSSQCLIKINDYTNNTCMVDVSDNLFTITPPTPVITVTAPNGGNIWYAGTAYTISWSTAYAGALVKIDYTVDGGTTWLPVTTSTSNSGSYNWTVPNNLSTNCLIKITDLSQPTTNDVSNAVFTIAPPFISVTTPNGGEVFTGCTTQTISWTAGGISGSYTLEYSTNGGTSWTFIATTGSSSYSWSVPSISSANTLVRVTNGSTSDVSNAAFTINPNADIVVTSPNGGNSLAVGSAQSITWASAGTSTNFTVYYSIDNGSTWTQIGSAGTSAHTMAWTVPNSPSTTCLIKVVDYYATCKFDLSDAVFTIPPPTPVLTVTTPNNSATYYAGNAMNINWSSAYVTTNFIKIEYTIDNGATWNTVVSAATTSLGTYAWTVPATLTTQFKVRITDTSNPLTTDISDASSTIAAPFITVNSPNGGEVFAGCTTQTISWTTGGISGSYTLEYSTNGGTSWNYIANTGSSSYNWSVPSISSSNTLVRVTNGSTSDVSNAAFTINPNTDIIVTSPNGGNSLAVGSAQSITWVSAGTSTNFTVYYSVDNGSTWTQIGSAGTSAHTMAWTVPNNPSTTCLIKVVDYYATCKLDLSDATFTIAAPTPVLTVTTPNNSATYYAGNAMNINWSSAYVTTNFIKIEYTIDNGATWSTVVSAATTSLGTYAWTVPATLTTQFKVRITDTSNPLTTDISDASSTIAAPFITVNSPNGGEVFAGCTTQTISWTTGGISGSYTLEYSTNGGTSWNYIANTGSSSYNWSVPSISSSNTLVRVTNGSTSDVSNAAFTINPNTDIIVTSPNGGNSLAVGSAQSITWVSAGTSTNFTVYYSVDNGSTWTQIGSAGTSAHTMAWTVPNNPSTTCLIKVVDYYATCKLDLSDATFTIAAPTPVLTVTTPNNSATYYAGNAMNINWSSAYVTTNFIKIEYTIDNGATWNTIISAATTSLGTYAWTVPATLTTQFKVRITDTSNPLTTDISDASSTIAAPFITVNSPNGGEVFAGCTTQTISWTTGGISGSYTLEYSTNGGTSWNYIANTGSSSYNWSVPSISSSNTLVRVTNGSTSDVSNAAFTINPNTDIIVTSPNGGNSLAVGSAQSITWVSAGTSTNFTVYYSVDNGSTWTQIGSAGTSAHTMAWTVPNNPSTTCLIKVVDYYATCKLDLSDATFTIAAPTPVLTVTTPNNSATYYAGNAMNINWSSAYVTTNFIKIEYTIDNGATWNTIISAATTSLGTYAWTVPATLTTQFKVRITDTSNPLTTDISDASSTIAAPFITVNSPNGGEVFAGCTTQTISWTTGGISGSYTLEYSTNGGTSWNYIANTGSSSYNWSVPSISSSNTLVRVTNGSTSDVSNAAFTINPNTDIIVTSPNGGNSLAVGSAQTITWASAGTSTNFTVYYSVDNGSTWTQIGSAGTSAHTMAWTVPNNPSTTCLIKVVDYYATCKYDLSNATFTIPPPTPQLVVTYPNGGGGQTLYYGSTYNITWSNAYFTSNFVAIYFSVDSGMTWQNIISATNNNGSYAWVLPNTFSSKCLIKIADYSNPSFYDKSDATFAIAPGMVLSTPNGDNGIDEWRVCTITTIQWTAGGGSNSYSLQYSVNNGTSWTTITSSATGSSYNWTIPNLPSTQCLVRVTDNSYPVKTDVSDATFTIKAAITVTSPNGGQSWPAASLQNITWTTYGASTYFNIDYSTNGGSTWTNIAFNQNIGTNTYPWTVPGTASTNALIRVTDNLNTCKVDQSDATFSMGVAQPTIAVTAPNGGETLSGCSTTNITWNYTGTSGSYTIEYTTNNGTTWSAIISNLTTAVGTYAWTVPNIASTQCKVRVKDYSNNTIIDASNANFTINQSTTASISPGGPVTFCSGGSVVLTSSSATGNVWSPGGQTTQSITVSTTGQYFVTVTSGGCSATSTTTTVTVNAIPAAPVASSNSPVSLNGTLNLYASTVVGASYAWTGPNTFTSILQNPTITPATAVNTGTYSVKAIVNGCQSAAGTVAVTVSSTAAQVTVTGNVLLETGAPVNTVKLKVTGAGTDSTTGAADGSYSFVLTQGSGYTITPTKTNDINRVNGISTLDLVLMQRHILNTQPLSSPYKIIAADVNLSGSVTNLDILFTKQLILGTTTSLPNNKIWSFVNSDYVFPTPNSPWPFEAFRAYSSAASAVSQNFVACKLGDVSNSYNNTIAKTITGGNLNFDIDNQSVVTGQLITVPVKVSNFNNVSGYQYTITWDASVLQLQQTKDVALAGDYNANNAASGSLTTLWSTELLNGVTLADGSTLFELSFKVIGNTGSSSPVTINSDKVIAEAYDHDLNAMNVVASAGTVSVDKAAGIDNVAGYALYQNVPNPYSNLTSVKFSLPRTEKVVFTLFNLAGQEMKKYEGEFKPGINTITLDTKDGAQQPLPQGTYIIRMQTGSFTDMKRMIIMAE